VSAEAANLAAAVATTATGVMVLIGVAVRFVLFPWLREHLVGPLLGRLDTLSNRLEQLAGDLRVASTMYEGHIELSGEDRANLWAAVREIRALMPRRHRLRSTRREDTTP
jgi:hypothetical protein